MTFDDIKLYLPNFLSGGAENELFSSLKGFPNNIDDRLYTTHLSRNNIIYQGDGFSNFSIFNLPNVECRQSKAMVLSNTCDIDINNKRYFDSSIVYAPIFDLKKYKQALERELPNNGESINQHINSIKKQELTQVFYLPAYKPIIDESIVFLDKLISIPNKMVDRGEVINDRLFTLSDYGIYLFVYKLSVHFCRIKDNVERRSANFKL